MKQALVPVGEILSQTDRAYQALRSAIVRCDLEPGSRLRVDELAEKLSVSSSPLREALSRLTGQELVQLIDKRGFRVAPLSVEGITDLTRVRLLVECEAMREAVRHGNDAWEADLVAAAHQLELAERRISDGPAILDDDWSARHRVFHLAMYSGASSPLLQQMIGDLFDKAERYRRFSARHRQGSRAKNDEHQQLMQSVIARDAQRATELLTQHISSTERNVRTAFLAMEGREPH